MGTSASFSPCMSIVGVATLATCFRAERCHNSSIRLLWNELAEFHLLILVVIGHVVIADEIGNSGDGDGRFEDPSLREQPVGQLSAVTGALDPEPVPVDPEKTPQSSADGVKHILALVALLLEPAWMYSAKVEDRSEVQPPVSAQTGAQSCDMPGEVIDSIERGM